MKTIIYPGTFDPITLGHVDLVERAAKLFDRVILAIAHSEKKQPMFEMQARIELCEQALAHLDNFEVCSFSGLLVELVKDKQACAVLRGTRTVADFEYELQMANMNRAMCPDFETLFLTPADNLSYISSTLVREIASMGGDASPFVPAAVQAALSQRFPA